MGTASVGSISMTGSGDTVIGPEGTSFSCETGPRVSITRIANTAVTFTAAGAPVTITKGSKAMRPHSGVVPSSPAQDC